MFSYFRPKSQALDSARGPILDHAAPDGVAPSGKSAADPSELQPTHWARPTSESNGQASQALFNGGPPTADTKPAQGFARGPEHDIAVQCMSFTDLGGEVQSLDWTPWLEQHGIKIDATAGEVGRVPGLAAPTVVSLPQVACRPRLLTCFPRLPWIHPQVNGSPCRRRQRDAPGQENVVGAGTARGQWTTNANSHQTTGRFGEMDRSTLLSPATALGVGVSRSHTGFSIPAVPTPNGGRRVLVPTTGCHLGG